MKERPSVLIIWNFLSKHTGSRSACEDLAERMLSAGGSVVIASSKPGRIARLLDMLNIIWTRHDQYKIAMIDVFSGPSFFWAEAVAFLLRRLGKPYVLTLRGGSLPDFAQQWTGRVVRLFKFASAVTAPSRYLLEQMKPYRSDLRLIPNSLDIPRYPFKIRSVPHPVLVWLRAFHDIYNAPLAIRVAASLIPQYPQIRLMMGGPDKRDGSYQKTKYLAETIGVLDAVKFAGNIPKAEVPVWLQGGEIFINTTCVDNTPVSVLEAMACGLPIVSTNVGGIPYLLEDEKDALLVPPDNPEAMASAIRRILTESGLAETLSVNARKKAERFDWSVILPKWEKLINDILGAKEYGKIQ